jgi:serine/threonine protein kinase
LKPQNVVLKSRDRNDPESSELVLIDFGIAQKYLDEFDKHIPLKKNVKFVGNPMFQSHNAFK